MSCATFGEVGAPKLRDDPDIGYAVPVHNGAKYLEEALSSLAAQTFQPRKVYIFENHSTDATVEIARKFVEKYPHFELCPAQTFLSAGENFNRAYDCLVDRHEFFGLLAHDDVLSPNYIEVLIDLLKANPKALMAVGDTVNLANPEAGPILFDPRILNPRSYVDSKRGYKSIEFPASWYYGIYRGKAARDLMVESETRFPSIWGGDRLQVLHFLLRGQLEYAPGTQFMWRPGSVSFRTYAEKRAIDMFRRRWEYHSIMWAQRHYLHPEGIWQKLAFWQICFHTSANHTYRLEPLLLGKYRRYHKRP